MSLRETGEDEVVEPLKERSFGALRLLRMTILVG